MPICPIPAADTSTERHPWRALHLFSIYRLSLVMSLGIAFFLDTGPTLLGRGSPILFGITIIFYFVLVLSNGAFLFWRCPSVARQVQYSVVVDSIAITFLMHASGGVNSGLGLLIAISIALGSLLTGGRLAFLFAALASLAVLAEQMYAQLEELIPVTTYTQGGLLGITFFAVALLAHGLANRLRETELLAQQRGLDLANLAQLNDYIIQHMTTGVLVIDAAARLRLMNDTARRLLDCPAATTGERLEIWLPELTRRLIHWRREPHRTIHPLHVAGCELQLELAPLGIGAQAGLLVFVEDRARIIAQAQQLKLASLGRLTASIAHEIRNPLGAISHAGQLLAESVTLPLDERRLTEIIANNVRRLNEVIETVLQLSRRDRAPAATVVLAVWLNEFIADFCYSRRITETQFHLAITPPDLKIAVDSRQFTQILSNLCGNAIKYAPADSTHPASIELLGSCSEKSAHPVLEVRDHGPGIPPDQARQIFEPFFTTSAHGTGLGLYITRELCEINHIELEFIPIPSGGSCFRLTFYDVSSENSDNTS